MIDHYIGYFFFGLGAIAELAVLWALFLGLSSRNWRSVQGTITSASISVTRNWDPSTHSSSVTYRPKIKYAYDYEGRTYDGKNIGYLLAYGSQKNADGLIARFREGKTVDVFIDPLKPKRSVLIPGVRPFHGILAISIPLLFILVGLHLMPRH